MSNIITWEMLDENEAFLRSIDADKTWRSQAHKDMNELFKTVRNSKIITIVISPKEEL